MSCWYCYWGWPKPIHDIFQRAVDRLEGDDGPIRFGPAHIVWEDENFDAAEWCLENLEGQKHTDTYARKYSNREMDVVRDSLKELLEVPKEFRSPPGGYGVDGGHDVSKFPPPAHWEMVFDL